jgi:hypothetical protein
MLLPLVIHTIHFIFCHMSSTKFMSAVRYCIISHNYVITRNPLHNGINNIILQDYIVNVNNVSSSCLIIYATRRAKFLFFARTRAAARGGDPGICFNGKA